MDEKREIRRVDLGIAVIFSDSGKIPAEILVNRKRCGLGIDLLGRRWRGGIQVVRRIIGPLKSGCRVGPGAVHGFREM